MITENSPTQNDFHFTEILDNTLPYRIVGYAAGSCPDSLHPYGYTPPTGWKVSSCTWMPPGSHGVAVGMPTVLISCEKINVNVDEGVDTMSALYPKPSENTIVQGKAYTIPGVEGFYIEQPNGMRYAVYGITLANIDYPEGIEVIAKLRLSPVYEDIIDVDQWGYIGELINIRKAADTVTPPMDISKNMFFVVGAAIASVLLIGGTIWANRR